MLRTAQQPNDGAWNVVNQQLNFPQNLTAWSVLSFADGVTDQIAHQFAANIESCCRKLGKSFKLTYARSPLTRHLLFRNECVRYEPLGVVKR
jgi:hypothetical protein